MSVSGNSVYVVVETDRADTAVVQYGTTIAGGMFAKSGTIIETPAATYIHKIFLNGLSSGTKYYYKVIQGITTSAIYDFKSAITPGTPFKFEWMADCRTGVDVHDQISVLMGLYNPLFILNGGDVCEFPTYDSWKNEFFRQDELNNLSRIPFFYCPGNHEGWNAVSQTFTISPVSPSGVEDYYSFDYGDYHFLSINNYVDYSAGSQQYNFIQNDLSTTNKRWKIVYCHQPPYCAGGHGNDSLMISISENLFVTNNVDLVFSGHSHFYQHNKVGNIHYMVIGCSGAPLYQPDTASYVVKSAMDYCFGVIDASTNSCKINVYNNYDVLLDTLTINKSPAVINGQGIILKDFELQQNIPNPFNPVTKIKFGLNKTNTVLIRIFDVSGKEITTLLNSTLTPGQFEISWDGSNFPSGVYFCRMETDVTISTIKMLLLK
jgi:predicted phosphodiesterase